MRGRKNSRCSEWRNRKRATLRVLLLAAAPIMVAPIMIAPAMAESPYSADQLLLPPLPLAGQMESVSPGPTINPFCQPAPTLTANARRDLAATTTLGTPRTVANRYVQMSTTAIQLASGGVAPVEQAAEQQTTIRLMPIGTLPAGEAVVTGAVRSNPMVANQPIGHPETDFQMPPLGQAGPADQSVERPGLAAEPRNAVTSSVASPLLRPSDAQTAVVKDGPVSFSLDDSNLVDTTRATGSPGSNDKSAASLMQKKEPLKALVAPPVVQAPVKGTIQFGMATSRAREIDKSTSIARGNGAGRTLLVPLPTVDDPRAIPKDRMIERVNDRENDSRIVKGVRPRVEVGVPPVAIERLSGGNATFSVPVAHVSPISPAKSTTEMALEGADAIRLEMKRAEVRSLKLDRVIRQVQIGDSSICAAIAAGPSQLQLIGTSDGITRLAVWTTSADGKENKDVYEIRVGSPSQSDANDPNKIAAALTRSATAAFPASAVQIRADNNRMIVDGTCPTEESAKQLLRMIRSACLLPVIDNLSVR